MQAVQNRPNSAGRLTGATKFSANVPHADPHEYFANILRKNLGPSNNGTGTLDARSARQEEVPFLSTSYYLREQFGVFPGNSCQKAADAKPLPGTPVYKTPEEYYDEVLELRKHIAEIVSENSVLKAKLRRSDDELAKREKELVQVFEKKLDKGDAGKTVDSPSRSDKCATTVQSMKLRLFKIEQKYKSRDAECRRLEADVRKTDVEELRHQLDICLGQIATLRYHNAKILAGQVSDRSVEAVQEVPSSEKPVEIEETESDETDSFTSDSETGYKGYRSRSSHSRSASRLSLQKLDSASKPKIVVAPAVQQPIETKAAPVSEAVPATLPTPSSAPLVKDDRHPSSETPRCNLKQHQKLEQFAQEMKEIRDAMAELDSRREVMAKGNGPVRVNQKLPPETRAGKRLLILDERETQLLQELNKITKENEQLKEKVKHLESEMVKQKEQMEAAAAAEIQSLLRAHETRIKEENQLKMSSERQPINFDNFHDEPRENAYIVSLQSLMRAHFERRVTYEQHLIDGMLFN